MLSTLYLFYSLTGHLPIQFMGFLTKSVTLGENRSKFGKRRFPTLSQLKLKDGYIGLKNPLPTTTTFFLFDF